MADSPSNVHIVIPKELRSRLQGRKHPRQTFAGVIQELIEQTREYTDNPDTLARLERYRTHPRETQDDLITNVLDQLEELEKTLSKEV